jgi:hypothetical protein
MTAAPDSAQGENWNLGNHGSLSSPLLYQARKFRIEFLVEVAQSEYSLSWLVATRGTFSTG